MSLDNRTLIKPFLYDVVLSRAEARVFNLSKRIKETAPALEQDKDIADILSQPSMEDAFDQPA